MADLLSIFNLVAPFFGLILLGFAIGRYKQLPEEGLAWLQFFLIYVALPPLFFKLISATPIEELANWRFILTTTLCTYVVFCLSFGVGLLVTRGNIKEGAIQGVFGSYSNIGYMGPPLTLAALGPGSNVPTVLIFVFDSMLLFTLVPFLMALGSTEKVPLRETTMLVFKRIFTHPFNVATFAGVAAAFLHWQPPQAIDTMLNLLKGSAAPIARRVLELLLERAR